MATVRIPTPLRKYTAGQEEVQAARQGSDGFVSSLGGLVHLVNVTTDIPECNPWRSRDLSSSLVGG